MLYRPLPSRQHIRLLEVRPGPVVGTVEGNLIVASLDRCPKFQALSYTWGSGTEIIECNGEYLKTSYIGAAAIRHHRSSDRPILLWIDSICINQQDLEEKGFQIQLMPHIYRKASEVIVWLHEATGLSDVGMDILHHCVEGGNGSIGPPPWKLRAPHLLQEGLSNVMNREWWSRGWTVQEMALSSRTRISCGHRQITWIAETDRIREIIRNIKLSEISYAWGEAGLTSTSMQPFLNLLQEQLKQISPPDLAPSTDIVDVIHSFRDKKFADPRDRIYAMLGLVPEVKFQPDYTMSVEQTWDMFMTAVGRHQDTKQVGFPAAGGTQLGEGVLALPGYRKGLPFYSKRWFGSRYRDA